MRVSRNSSFSAKVIAMICGLGMISTMGLAQEQDYTKPRSPWTVVGPYTSRAVPNPNLVNAPRLDQLLKGGKLMLSLNDAIALTLENNLDIAIARYNLPIADTDILRTKSGGAARGVNTGLVSGTLGGTTTGTSGSQGSGSGGTTSGAGGAGSGSGGIVTSTSGAGSAVDSFDPILSGTLAMERATILTANAISTGRFTFQQNTTTGNFGYFQGFQSGTALNVGFNNNRLATDSTSALFPALSSSFRATVRQHLLQGFGFAPNTRFIRIAKNNREISDLSFKNQIISTVSQVQNIYWDLVNAYEDLKVKQRSLALADKTLGDNRKQVEIGTLAPIEIVRAQSEVATRNQDLIISQTNLQLQQLFMLNAISRNVSDATLATVEIVPTDQMMLTAVEPVRPIQDLINDALAHRPDLVSQRIDLTNRGITDKATRNALLPTLDLNGWYGGAGLTGNTQSCVAGVCTLTGAGRGYGGAVGDLFDSTAPDKGVSLTLNIPLRNRAAQADQVRSQLELRQAQMRLRQVENEINIGVRNSQFAVTQNRARVDAAQKARDLAAESLDAEQKKYALGASTNTLVLQAQRDFAQSDSNVVAAMAAYEKSIVALDQTTGFTLERNGIQFADAVSGNLTKLPSAPNVGPAPARDTTPLMQTPAPTQP